MTAIELDNALEALNNFFAGVSSYTSPMEVLKIRFEKPEPETEYELVCLSCTYMAVPTSWDNVNLTSCYLDSREEHIVITDTDNDVKIICREATLNQLI